MTFCIFFYWFDYGLYLILPTEAVGPVVAEVLPATGVVGHVPVPVDDAQCHGDEHLDQGEGQRDVDGDQRNQRHRPGLLGDEEDGGEEGEEELNVLPI